MIFKTSTLSLLIVFFAFVTIQHYGCEAQLDIKILNHHYKSFSTDGTTTSIIPSSNNNDRLPANNGRKNDRNSNTDETENEDSKELNGVRGITYDVVREFFYALPDSMGMEDVEVRRHLKQRMLPQDENDDDDDEEPGPRFNTVKIDRQQIIVEGTTTLKDESGNEYGPQHLFPISIAYSQNSLFVAHHAGIVVEEEDDDDGDVNQANQNNKNSEDSAEVVTTDGVFVYNMEGLKLSEIDLPTVANGKLHGIAVGGDHGNMLFSLFKIANSDMYQVIQTDLDTGFIEAEHLYVAEENSHIAMMALDSEGMLFLECVADDSSTYTINIYHATLIDDDTHNRGRRQLRQNDKVTNIKATNGKDLRRMTKTLLNTIAGVANFESLAMRPKGGNGHFGNRQELIMVTNNRSVRSMNRNAGTDFIAFRARYRRGRRNDRKNVDFPEPDETCINFCDEYWSTCASQNAFFEKRYPRGFNTADTRFLRELFVGSEAEVPRVDRSHKNGGSESEAYEQCLGECMLYPRPPNPLDFDNRDTRGVNLGGDTLWCRMRRLADAATTDTNDAVYFCPQASPSGGGVCTDADIDAETAYERYRQGTTTARRLGQCDLLHYDTIADCSSSEINDDNIERVLAFLPDTIEIIFMNDNAGITSLKNSTFDVLACPECILGLFIEEASIATIESGTFDHLWALEVLNLNQNLIQELPDGLFFNLFNLRQFSMFQGPNKPGLLTNIPESLFLSNLELERVILDGHAQLTSLPKNLFQFQFELEMISFKRCGITNTGLPSGIFDTLISLTYFDFSHNQLTFADNTWFTPFTGEFVIRVAIDNNEIVTLETGVFDDLLSLEFAYLHDNVIEDIPSDLFQFNTELIAYTLG